MNNKSHVAHLDSVQQFTAGCDSSTHLRTAGGYPPWLCPWSQTARCLCPCWRV